MVQKGKFSVGIASLVMVLKRRDLPAGQGTLSEARHRCAPNLSAVLLSALGAGQPRRHIPEGVSTHPRWGGPRSRPDSSNARLYGQSPPGTASTYAHAAAIERQLRTFRLLRKRPRIGRAFSSSFFLGGMVAQEEQKL